MAVPTLGTLIGELDFSTGDAFALFGSIDNDTGISPGWQSASAAVSPDSLPGTLRVDTAWVRPGQDDVLEEVSALLARLRDVHAERVIVLGDSIDYGRTFYTALGFELRKSPSVNGLMFVWDSQLANRPRAWNNAERWANPQNFSKYRW